MSENRLKIGILQGMGSMCQIFV